MTTAVEPVFARDIVTQPEDAEKLIAVREAAAECESLLREKLSLMQSFCEVSERLAEARLRYDSLRSAAFRGHTILHYDADGNPAGSHREDILDPGPVVTMEHLVATNYDAKRLRDAFVRACVMRG